MNAQEARSLRLWRTSHNLSVADLAERTGYSIEQVYRYERAAGELDTGRPRVKGVKPWPITPWVWQRFRLACAAVDHELRTGKSFEWR